MLYKIEEDVDGTWCVVDAISGAPAALAIGYAVGFNRTDASIVCDQFNVNASLAAKVRAEQLEPVA